MRPVVFAALIALSACTASPRPNQTEPLPTLSVDGEALLVVRALEAGCRTPGTPDAPTRRALSEGWIRIIPETEYVPCAVEVDGPSARIAAVNDALLAYAQGLDLTWNVRDSRPLWSADGRRVIRRTRGESGQGEPEMTWTFTEFQAPTEEVTTLRVEWEPARLQTP